MKPILLYTLKVWLSFSVLASIFSHIAWSYIKEINGFDANLLFQYFLTLLIGSIPFSVLGFLLTRILINMQYSAIAIKTGLCVIMMTLTFLLFWQIIRGVDYHNDGIIHLTKLYGVQYLYPLLAAIPFSIYMHKIPATEQL